MDVNTISASMIELARIDEDVAQAYQLIGPPEPRHRPQGFETFIATIVSQQISTEAAGAIMRRVGELLPHLSAQNVVDIEGQLLRDAGLSWRKIEYARGLAQAVISGQFDIGALQTLSDEEAIQAITAMRGFGRWSAEIYLMFSLNRPDIFPADDLALRVALQRLKKIPHKLTASTARALTSDWSPWRSVGSLFLWHYYRGAPA